jgi:hypothetical protein
LAACQKLPAAAAAAAAAVGVQKDVMLLLLNIQLAENLVIK